MSNQPILIPLLIQVFLTLAVWLYLYTRRLPEINSKGIDPQALADRAESHKLLPASANASNNLKNLFELPVLFYLAILLALVLMIQDPVLVVLAWVFAIFRVIHSFIHCTYNTVMHRFIAYAISCLALILMWLRLASFILIH
jgi:hypothetical protein